MTTATIVREEQTRYTNRILHGDCIDVMRQMPAASVDFILTDPPYLVNYRDRFGRTLHNDTDADWLKPAMAEAYRVLKQNRLMVCFYGWPRADDFLNAWHSHDNQQNSRVQARVKTRSCWTELRYVLTRAGARPESHSRGNATGEPPCGDSPMNALHASAGSRVVAVIHLHAKVLAPRQQSRRAARCRATEGIKHQLPRQREYADERCE